MEENEKKQGFAKLSPERRREISSIGGKAAHKKGTAHQFDSKEAREAGRKGGAASRASRRQPALNEPPAQ